MIAARRFFARLAAAFLMGFLTSQAQTIPSYSAANLVLGQLLFTTNASASPANATSLATPGGVAVDPVSGKVFVADTGNNRVLRYSSQTALASGAIPEIVIGQLNFSGSLPNQTGSPIPSQTSLSGPNDVFVDAAGRLWIADTANSRVLLFENAANLFNTPAADRVFGQLDFGSAVIPPTNSGTLALPAGVCVDSAGTLWVADTNNHRVLGWKNAATLSNGTAASRVLGQPNFTSSIAAISPQSGLYKPTGVAADATHVWVADSGSNRVVMYANFPTINGAPASLVLGQKDYTTSTPTTSAIGMTTPTSVALSGSTLFVADSGNNRVLSFAAAADLDKDAPATGVIGQASYTASSSGLSSQRIALSIGAPAVSHLGVDAAGDLFAADSLNNRILRFPATPAPTPTPAPAAPPTVAIKGKKNFNTSKSAYTLKGTAAAGAGIRRVSYNLNRQGYLFAKGTTSWKAKIHLDAGRNKIVVNSVAIDGTVSAPKSVIIYRQ